MTKLSYLQTGFMIVCLGWTVLGFAQLSATEGLPFPPNQYSGFYRTSGLSSLIQQDESNGWQDRTKTIVTYNNQGCYATIYYYRMEAGVWTPWKERVYTYDDSDRLLQMDTSQLYTGGWVANQRVVYTYDGINLERIGHHTLHSNTWVCLDYTDLFYHPVTGVLEYAISTSESIEMPITFKFKYVYEWDGQGRIGLVYNHRKSPGADWVLSDKQVYTYLPADNSTYSQHFQYIVDAFAGNETRFSHGHHPFLYSVINRLSYNEANDTWNPYQKWEYLYDQEDRITHRQFSVYDDYDSEYEIDSETHFEYADNQVISEMYYTPTSGVLYPRSRILYVYSNTVVDDDYHASPVVCKVSLYPNPFRQATTIELDLAKTSTVCISVYNQKGQRIRDICSNKLERGQHMLHWDGKDANGRPMAAGIYVIRLNTKNQSVVRKVVLY